MAIKLLLRAVRGLSGACLTLWVMPLVVILLGVGVGAFALAGAALSGVGVTAVLILLFARDGGPTAALAAGPGFAAACMTFYALQAKGVEWIDDFDARVKARKLRKRERRLGGK